MKKGDFQAAAAHLRRALENDATTATTYSDLADALTHMGEAEQAIPLLEKAIGLNPFDPYSRKMLIVQLDRDGTVSQGRDCAGAICGVFPRKTVSCGRRWPAPRRITRNRERAVAVPLDLLDEEAHIGRVKEYKL